MQSKLTKLLRRHQVEEIVGLKRSAIYAMMSDGRFPRPVRVGTRAVAWREADIEVWLNELAAA